MEGECKTWAFTVCHHFHVIFGNNRSPLLYFHVQHITTNMSIFFPLWHYFFPVIHILRHPKDFKNILAYFNISIYDPE